MNIFLTLGILVFTGYLVGHLAGIIGYIFVGIIFSPHTMHLLSDTVMENTQALRHMALAFITFAIGGELKWAKMRPC